MEIITTEKKRRNRFRRAVAAADANLNASVRDYDSVMVCLLAEVVTAYVDIRTAQVRLEFVHANVEFQEGSLQLAKVQADEGSTDYVSVAAAESSLETTRSRIQPLETDLRQASNRLCTLLGIPTIDLLPELGDGSIPVVPAEVAVGIPADLLRRRPDVRAAEWRVAEASEQIGIALTDLYPAFSITGSFGYGAANLSQNFDPSARFNGIGPGFQWNILNYGRIRNNVRSRRALFQESVTSYQNTVIEANQEVEDALVAFQKSQQQAEALRGSAQAMKRALDLKLIQFTEGEDDFTGVFVFQSDLVQRQDNLAQTRGYVITNLVQLYKALGGGWEARHDGFPLAELIESPGTNGSALESETIDLPSAEPVEEVGAEAEVGEEVGAEAEAGEEVGAEAEAGEGAGEVMEIEERQVTEEAEESEEAEAESMDEDVTLLPPVATTP